MRGRNVDWDHPAKERTEGKIATNFAQYKKLLDRKDIDAVVVPYDVADVSGNLVNYANELIC